MWRKIIVQSVGGAARLGLIGQQVGKHIVARQRNQIVIPDAKVPRHAHASPFNATRTPAGLARVVTAVRFNVHIRIRDSTHVGHACERRILRAAIKNVAEQHGALEIVHFRIR